MEEYFPIELLSQGRTVTKPGNNWNQILPKATHRAKIRRLIENAKIEFLALSAANSSIITAQTVQTNDYAINKIATLFKNAEILAFKRCELLVDFFAVLENSCSNIERELGEFVRLIKEEAVKIINDILKTFTEFNGAVGDIQIEHDGLILNLTIARRAAAVYEAENKHLTSQMNNAISAAIEARETNNERSEVQLGWLSSRYRNAASVINRCIWLRKFRKQIRLNIQTRHSRIIQRWWKVLYCRNMYLKKKRDKRVRRFMFARGYRNIQKYMLNLINKNRLKAAEVIFKNRKAVIIQKMYRTWALRRVFQSSMRDFRKSIISMRNSLFLKFQFVIDDIESQIGEKQKDAKPCLSIFDVLNQLVGLKYKVSNFNSKYRQMNLLLNASSENATATKTNDLLALVESDVNQSWKTSRLERHKQLMLSMISEIRRQECTGCVSEVINYDSLLFTRLLSSSGCPYVCTEYLTARCEDRTAIYRNSTNDDDWLSNSIERLWNGLAIVEGKRKLYMPSTEFSFASLPEYPVILPLMGLDRYTFSGIFMSDFHYLALCCNHENEKVWAVLEDRLKTSFYKYPTIYRKRHVQSLLSLHPFSWSLSGCCCEDSGNCLYRASEATSESKPGEDLTELYKFIVSLSLSATCSNIDKMTSKSCMLLANAASETHNSSTLLILTYLRQLIKSIKAEFPVDFCQYNDHDSLLDSYMSKNACSFVLKYISGLTAKREWVSFESFKSDTNRCLSMIQPEIANERLRNWNRSLKGYLAYHVGVDPVVAKEDKGPSYDEQVRRAIHDVSNNCTCIDGSTLQSRNNAWNQLSSLFSSQDANKPGNVQPVTCIQGFLEWNRNSNETIANILTSIESMIQDSHWICIADFIVIVLAAHKQQVSEMKLAANATSSFLCFCQNGQLQTEKSKSDALELYGRLAGCSVADNVKASENENDNWDINQYIAFISSKNN